MIGPEAVGVLALAAFATSAFTAAIGLGGGMILLAVMLLYLDPWVAIPLHGAVQLVSNASRTAIQRRHVRWDLVGRYGVLLLPAGAFGLVVSRQLPVAAVRAAIGAFVLLAVWAPRALLLGVRPEDTHPTRRFFWLGGVTGFLNTTVGATGPLQGPFYRNLGLSRQGVVGSFAAAQTLGHATKLLLFGLAGFAFARWLPPLALLAACVTAGTWVGSRLLERVSERTFELLYRATLTLLAVRLLV